MKWYLLFFSLLVSFSFLYAQKKLERKFNRSIAMETGFKGAQVSISVFDLEEKRGSFHTI